MAFLTLFRIATGRLALLVLMTCSSYRRQLEWYNEGHTKRGVRQQRGMPQKLLHQPILRASVLCGFCSDGSGRTGKLGD